MSVLDRISVVKAGFELPLQLRINLNFWFFLLPDYLCTDVVACTTIYFLGIQPRVVTHARYIFH